MNKPRRIASVFSLNCLISLFCVMPNAGRSQTVKGQSEVSVGVGVESSYELISRYTAGDNNGYIRSPVFSLSYRYHLTGNFSFGINITYQRFVDYDVLYEDPLYQHTVSSYTFIAPEATVCYLNRKTGAGKNVLRLYGLVSAGVAIYSERGSNNYNNEDYSEKQVLPAFQLTPIGARFGNEFAAFIEAGVGNKGLINAGLSYCFPKKKIMAGVH